MTAFSLTTAALFDGQEWCGPCTVHVRDGLIRELTPPVPAADLAAEMVAPGLVDYGVSVSGYQERPDGECPFAPEEAFGLLCLRYGVTTVVDLANNWSTIVHFNSGRHPRSLPRMLFGGARLCDFSRSRHDVVVTPDSCRRIVKWQTEWGASFLSMGKFEDAALVGSILQLAQELQLPLVWPGLEPDQPGCFWTWPHVTPAVAWPDGATALVDTAAYFAPHLEAAHRGTIDGLLEADFAHLAAPVTPYARNFARMSGLVGRRIGRRVLENIYGQRQSSSLHDEVEASVRSFVRHGACLAASGAVRAGVVPGLSLWHEIGRLGSLLADNEEALRCAGAAGAGLWPGLGLGRIEPGSRADLLLFDQVWDKGSIWQLLESLRTVISGGEHYEIDRLDQELKALVGKALKEAI